MKESSPSYERFLKPIKQFSLDWRYLQQIVKLSKIVYDLPMYNCVIAA